MVRSEKAAKPPQPPPLACPIARLSAESPSSLSAEDAALFKGNVPSMASWQDAWAVLSETMALRKAGRLCTKNSPDVTPLEHKKRKRYRSQQIVMAEVLRNKIHRVMREATSIR